MIVTMSLGWYVIILLSSFYYILETLKSMNIILSKCIIYINIINININIINININIIINIIKYSYSRVIINNHNTNF